MCVYIYIMYIYTHTHTHTHTRTYIYTCIGAGTMCATAEYDYAEGIIIGQACSLCQG